MKETIKIHVNIELTPAALQAVVENAKEIAGADQRGVYKVDTAEKVSEMITKFLLEKDFESYAMDIGNYPRE